MQDHCCFMRPDRRLQENFGATAWHLGVSLSSYQDYSVRKQQANIGKHEQSNIWGRSYSPCLFGPQCTFPHSLHQTSRALRAGDHTIVSQDFSRPLSWPQHSHSPSKRHMTLLCRYTLRGFSRKRPPSSTSVLLRRSLSSCHNQVLLEMISPDPFDRQSLTACPGELFEHLLPPRAFLQSFEGRNAQRAYH